MRKTCCGNPNKGLSFLYNTALGRMILKPLVTSCFASKMVGHFMDSKLSKLIIKPFVKKNNINLNDYVNTNYSSFNDFFTRKIKLEKRIIDMNKNSFISPCDAKLTCYKIDEHLKFMIKNSMYDVSEVISNKKQAKKYLGGYALIFRLSPDDYHRYCFIDDGTIINTYKIKGFFHTVNPIVYDKYKVFKENTRCVTLIKTNNFNCVMQVEVGALLVGKIKNFNSNKKVKKGMEKGYFEYGGSTILLLVKKDVIDVDLEILNNSKNGLETYVKYGEKIGKKRR